MDAPGGVDDDGADVVVDRLAGIRAPELQPELLADGGDVDEFAGQVIPVRRVGLVAVCVFLEARQGVVIGIDGEAEEMPVGRAAGHGLELALGFLEVDAQARAEGREGTAREDEGEGEGLPLEFTEPHEATLRVGERVVGHGVADGQRLHVAYATQRWLGRGERGARLGEFLELIDPSVVLRHQHAEGEGVARLQSVEFLRVLHVEQHGHGFHVAGDVLVGDLDLLPLVQDFAHDALDLEGALVRRGEGCRWGRGGGGFLLFARPRRQGQRRGHQQDKEFLRHRLHNLSDAGRVDKYSADVFWSADAFALFNHARPM